MGISAKSIKAKVYKVIKLFPQLSTFNFQFSIIFFCFILPGFLAAQSTSTDISVKVNGKKYYQHIVSKGETIYGIAEKYNLKPKDIVLENPNAIDGVNTGDTLLIPFVGPIKQIADTSTADEKQGNYIYHTVIGKETLYSLSKRYHTSITLLDSLNPEVATSGLQKGHKIRIPVLPFQPTVVNKPHIPSRDTIKTLPNGKKAETQAYKSLVVEQTHTDVSKGNTSTKDTGKKMNRYNIALIMPFAPNGSDTLHLARLMEGTAQIPAITQVSIDFYHGILSALDSLEKRGFKANLRMYNVLAGNDSSNHVIDSILAKPEMLTMNLIIGPPYPSNFKKVAKFADKHNIPIVSPLSSESSVLKSSEWTSKTTPSSFTETEFEADYIVAHYRGANIVVVHNKDANEEYYQAFQKRFKKADSAFGRKDTLRHAESMGGVTALGARMSNNLINVIIMPYQGASFVAKFVNELANSKYAHHDSLVVFGMHNWAENDALDPANLDTLNIHFPTNEYLNYTDLATKKFILKYRNDYLSEPSYYSFEGYDAGMFYGNLLWMYGTNIQNHLSDTKYRGLQTSFDMLRTSLTTGYENKAVYMLEYKNYTEKLDSK